MLIAYIVVIKYNDNFVGVKLSPIGTFIEVLEQRDQTDNRKGQRSHPGEPLGDRGAPQQDTLALSDLPSVVKLAFTTRYATDTLLHVLVTPDTTYILISKNNGLFTTAISDTGTIFQRQQMRRPQVNAGQLTAITQSNFPSAIATYLSITYPSYVFNQAFAVKSKGVLAGYDVFITANNTKYAVNFDASGTFVTAFTLR